jgi:pimeloyl-ACP methyl ester carboxylesterase
LLGLPVIAINADHWQTNIESIQLYGVEVVIMPEVGHFLMLEDPPRFNAILETSIKKLLGQ